MVFLRSSLIVVGGIAFAATSTTASSLLEMGNSTTTHAQLEYDYRRFWFHGVDLVGGDTWADRYPSPESCVPHCLVETGCDAATWTDYQGGTCFFKRLLGSFANAVPKVGAISFIRRGESNNPLQAPSFPADTDMPGNDIGSVYAPNFLECNAACTKAPNCYAFTWTKDRMCLFKSTAVPYVYSPGARSGFVTKYEANS
jgi:hypothetical protein